MKQKKQDKQHCGFVVLVGRPNVGKSTLFNAMLGQKISITADKPQTTRHRIMGVKTVHNTQMIFLDTPGLNKVLAPKHALHKYMTEVTVQSLEEVNVAVFMVEALKFTENDEAILRSLVEKKLPIILAINKVDRVKEKEELLPYMHELSQKAEFAATVPMSALNSQNIDILQKEIEKYIPEDDFYFPPDVSTASSDEFLAAELVREKLMRLLGQEVPYALTVEIEVFEVKNKKLQVNALIWVERDGQKRIVIGKKGEMLKKVGISARRSMESLFGEHVNLQLWVKVKRGWSDDERALQRFGYKSS